MKTQRSAPKQTNPVQKVSIFFENKKDLKLFRFSYKIAKTANSETAWWNKRWLKAVVFKLCAAALWCAVRNLKGAANFFRQDEMF
jgi:hypothetical protein